MKRILALASISMMASCGQADNDPGPGGVTVSEARALDEAAEMLDARQLPPEPETPETQASPPSQGPAQTD